jgi:hypothetical protein
MRGGYVQLLKEVGASRVSSVIEQAKAKHAEECELRLARIMNGKEKGYENGHPKRRA